MPTKLRTFSAGVGLLAGSYLLAGLVNAAPVSQPRFSAPRSRGTVVIIVPAAPDEHRPAAPGEIPALQHEQRSTIVADARATEAI